MALYTFIAEFKGGTYMSQVVAPNPKSAVFAWAQNLEVEAIYGFGDKSKQILTREVLRDEEEGIGYVPLKGLINAWCVDALVRGHLMLINFVETNENHSPSS